MIADRNDPLESKRKLAAKKYLYKTDARAAERILVEIEKHFDS
jgi:hypothetical protein